MSPRIRSVWLCAAVALCTTAATAQPYVYAFRIGSGELLDVDVSADGSRIAVSGSVALEVLDADLRPIVTAPSQGGQARMAPGGEELVLIEIVDRGHRLGCVVAPIAQQFADMGPVLLLNMSIVVFLVGTTTCELDPGFLLTVSPEMIVDEFTAIV